MTLKIGHVEVLALLGRMARVRGDARLRPERVRFAEELVSARLATSRAWRGAGAPEYGKRYEISDRGKQVLRAAEIGAGAARRAIGEQCACAALRGGDEEAWRELAAALA